MSNSIKKYYEDLEDDKTEEIVKFQNIIKPLKKDDKGEISRDREAKCK